ncbi:hypothetical protein [Serratia quinivorans]|uniref:hypothetical protein n=1 Tax=Serratia quinivorans TaxID=137545 RepID=UPI0021B7EFCE|nr:hypothetical protein [Serratia quinivorans]
MSDAQYSAQNFERFLHNLPSSNIVSEATARNLRDASLRLLGHISGLDEIEDVRDLKVEDLIERLRLASEGAVSSASMQAYKSRFQSALDKFIAFENGDLTPTIDEMRHNTQMGKTRMTPQRKIVKQECDTKTFELPIPLRNDLLLRIENLPLDLTKEEAAKISKIIEAYARDDEL